MTDEPRDPLPPLRIHHLMIWMAAVAAVLSLFGEVYRADEIKPTLFALVYFSVTLTLQSVAAATLGLGIYWKIKGKPFFGEVGHWLLVSNTLALVSNGLPVMLHLFSSNLLQSPGWTYYRWLGSILRASLFGVLIIVASRTAANTAAWKRFCKHVGVMCLLGALLQVFGLLVSLVSIDGNIGWSMPWLFFPVLETVVIPIYWGILCALSVREDFKSGRRRHWSHWCGTIIWLGAAIARMAPSLFS